jgi:lathosterol oxidase
MFFNYNYGLYFTLWDRIGGTHRVPSVNLGNGPLDHIRKAEESKELVTEERLANKPKAA